MDEDAEHDVVELPPMTVWRQSSPSIPNRQSPLLRFPRELRDMILKPLLLFPRPLRRPLDFEKWMFQELRSLGDYSHPHLASTAIMGTCLQLYNEAAVIFYTTNTFRFDIDADDDRPYCPLLRSVRNLDTWFSVPIVASVSDQVGIENLVTRLLDKVYSCVDAAPNVNKMTFESNMCNSCIYRGFTRTKVQWLESLLTDVKFIAHHMARESTENGSKLVQNLDVSFEFPTYTEAGWKTSHKIVLPLSKATDLLHSIQAPTKIDETTAENTIGSD